MTQGRIIKALSGFYYVDTPDGIVTCRGSGKLRHEKLSPLVGDEVSIRLSGDGGGTVEAILPRRNQFARPAVANIDQLVIVASGVIPVTDPFLIDRMTASAQRKGCRSIICINKCDLDRADGLYETYRKAGFETLRVSAETGEGIEELRAAMAGKLSAFTGNSGVGKSSLLRAIDPELNLAVGEVSAKLGRGRHTTRHVELFGRDGTYIADTPGFSSLDADGAERIRKEELAAAFPDFQPYLGQCRFVGCSHTKEKGCAVLAACRAGDIAPSRHASYLRLYEQAKQWKDWQLT